MIKTHNIEEVSFNKNFMYLKVDGKTLKLSIEKISMKLFTANEVQKELYIISPSGYGIHWPLIDEDLSIDYLMKLEK
ncbi:MAG: DUF2442 domain-containing protein [Sphingobacteriia bacterium]|nr:DUF2442 domain-containing protein [Sphingobacteriia bacterium]